VSSLDRGANGLGALEGTVHTRGCGQRLATQQRGRTERWGGQGVASFGSLGQRETTGLGEALGGVSGYRGGRRRTHLGVARGWPGLGEDATRGGDHVSYQIFMPKPCTHRMHDPCSQLTKCHKYKV
jgi:hypothetical protein